MDLREWITASGRSQDEVGRAVGISRAQMNRIVRGTSQASTEVTERIRRLTGGAVGPADLHRARVAHLVGQGLLLPEPTTLSAPTTGEVLAA